MSATSSEQEGRLAIAASFVAEPVEQSLQYWMGELGMTTPIAFAPFDQVFQQLLDPESLLGANREGTNIVLLRIEDWLSQPAGDGFDATVVDRHARDLVAALTVSARRGIPHLLFFCPASPRVWADAARQSALRQTEAFVADQLSREPGVHVVTSDTLDATYPVTDFYDAHADRIGRIPYTMPAFTALGTAIARTLHAPSNLRRKLVILDADQTLWSGVCAEDGTQGIRLGAEHIALQQFMLEQHRAGMLLALCSANDEADVAEVFRQRTDMPLARDHFAGWRVDWRPKSENIASLALELDVGLDSIVFIDDDDAACAEVRAHCPEVLTLQLPRRSESIPQFLRHLWVFDRLKITREAGLRTANFHDQARREQVRVASPTLEDFIAGLDLRCEVSPLAAADIPRVTELTHRTNQFNLTTLRRSEAEIQALCRAEGTACLVVRVADRFGDYGLVGVLIVQRQSAALAVTTCLLSCRALGRGVEFRMLAALGETARSYGLDWVDLVYVPTARNRPARNFLDTVLSAVADAGAGTESDCDDPDPRRAAPARRIRIAASSAVMLPPTGTSETGFADGAADPDEARATVNEIRAASSAAVDVPRYESIATDCCDVVRIHQAILSLSRRRQPLSTPFVAPRTKLEKDLAAIWSALFGIDQIGVDDNFFELGGHSLLAMQMLARIRDTCQVELGIRSLFSDQFTIASVAGLVLEEQVRAGNQVDIEWLVGEIDSLTDEEVKALLDQADVGAGRSGR